MRDLNIKKRETSIVSTWTVAGFIIRLLSETERERAMNSEQLIVYTNKNSQ